MNSDHNNEIKLKELRSYMQDLSNAHKKAKKAIEGAKKDMQKMDKQNNRVLVITILLLIFAIVYNMFK